MRDAIKQHDLRAADTGLSKSAILLVYLDRVDIAVVKLVHFQQLIAFRII